MTTTTICNQITDELREALARRVLTWPHPGDSVDILLSDGRGHYNVIVCLADLFLTPDLLDGLVKAGASIVQERVDLPVITNDNAGETPASTKETIMSASERILKVLDDETAELSKGGYAATLVAVKDEIETRLTAVCEELSVDPRDADQFGEDEEA